ncbi:hypothetical protein EYZ11_000891 [Aspergillus tanneri]|uniref:CRAL-TRIO domain-containing protein n=1 Tax=Aspergillus tanneri TaxID=1220188 RepID=A0A4S3JVY6_9EURO|nr:hypothetical protein EYZ11_000891 [Aspergillus tanneri]
MTQSTQQTGYVNHLTEDQEAKLRELWILLFTSAASVLSAVYNVPLPDGPSNRLFEVIDNIEEPSVDAIIAALKREKQKTSPQTNPKKREQSSLDHMESLINNDQAEKTLVSEMATRKLSVEHFSALLTELRTMGVSESEIGSMERILSRLTPQEMCFAILKMVKQDHPDSLLLRFLRARKWDVGRAFAMMASAILWRKEMEVDDDIMPKGELHALKQSKDESNVIQQKQGADFLAQLRMGKSYLRGVDRQGRPINVVRVRLHRPGDQSEETLERYIVHVIESTRLLLKPPVETGEYAPVKFIIKCFEANYPESLGVLLIHNAPWIFSGIWKIIHPWMDPVVASKVHFTRNITDLEKFIDRSQLTKDFGGDADWTYDYIEPQLDENVTMEDTATRDALMVERTKIGLKMLAATAAWISASSDSQGTGDRSHIAELTARREKFIEDFRLNYWKLDPYIRARAIIDRMGELKPDDG